MAIPNRRGVARVTGQAAARTGGARGANLIRAMAKRSGGSPTITRGKKFRR
jgi:hypothetical protein